MSNVQKLLVMLKFQLTKSSTNEDLKRYFTAVLELSQCDNKFPINLDEVWPLVYAERGVAVKALRKNFFENEDFISLDQNVKREIGSSVKTDYYLSLSCLEYFIARKVRPVFEVYRQVFHRTAMSVTPSYQIDDPVKRAERWIEEQKERNLLEAKSQEQEQRISLMLPKVRTYEQVINTPQEEWLKTTTSVANEIGMSGQRLNQMLVACGVIYKAPNGEYLFCSEYLGWNLGQTVSVAIGDEKNRVKTYIKWNTRGRAYIHALYDCNWDKRRAWHLLKRGVA